MSSDPISDDEQAEVDDGTLSEVVRRPTRAAGDLSERADAAAGITLEELLLRVGRMENEISELNERVHRIERDSRSSPVSPDTDSEPVTCAVPPGPEKPKPINPTLPTPLP